LRWVGQKAGLRAGAKILEFCRSADDNALEINLSHAELSVIPMMLMGTLSNRQSLKKSSRGELEMCQWNSGDNISPLQNLRTLRLDHNFISSLGLLDVGRIKNLQVLDLSSNQLTAFSVKNPVIRSLFSLTNQRELNLKGNRINKLPQEVSQLTRLTLLNLSNNRLEEIPSSLASLSPTLTHLLLAGNRALEHSDFPSPIMHLTNLLKLDVRGNSFHSIPSLFFHKLVHLQDLDLSGNNFSLHSHASNCLTSLFKLNLSHLPLSDLSSVLV